MKSVTLNFPTLAFVVSTRAALASGIGLLLSEKIPEKRRRVVGTALVALGAITTIPAVLSIVRSARSSRGCAPEARNEAEIAGIRSEPTGITD